jgi:hypothetical protein
VLGRRWFQSLAIAAFVAGCAEGGPSGPGPQVAGPTATPPVAIVVAPAGEAVSTPGILLDPGHTVGPPIVIDNLAVFPVYARVMEDLGEFVSLDDALATNTVVVHEVAAEGGGDGARVNTLVIENRGDVPILVLAGTVVKGGKQDRQIGQDFIIGKRQTVPVDAFCVEHGRWNANRNGVATQGSFTTLKTLAVGEVRAAGQYEKDQGQVWSKVGQVNRATGKETASGTLTASLEDEGLVAERSRVGAKVSQFLGAVPMAERTVGLAYAVGGEVTGARWFIHHKLFARYEETLVNTAVGEAFTARALAKSSGQPLAPGACAADKVASFVNDADHGKREERKTAGENTNAYQFSDDVYAAEAQMKAPAASPAAPPKAVTKDFLKKK